MSRRAALPGASELFRLTSTPALEPVPVREPAANSKPEQLEPRGNTRRGSGRQKHDSKITVYVSGDELVAMEQARLALRATHGLAVDRGRLVREAVAVLLADFEQHGPDSVLVQRLRDSRFGTEEATRS